MFDIVFGATLRLHITKVQLLIKDLYLEKWKCQLLDLKFRRWFELSSRSGGKNSCRSETACRKESIIQTVHCTSLRLCSFTSPTLTSTKDRLLALPLICHSPITTKTFSSLVWILYFGPKISQHTTLSVKHPTRDCTLSKIRPKTCRTLMLK